MRKLLNPRLRFWLLSLVFLGIGVGMYIHFLGANTQVFHKRFQKEFRQLEEKVNDFSAGVLQQVKGTSTEGMWRSAALKNAPYSVHIWDKDSLVFWNDHLMPLDFLYANDTAGNRVVALENGFYFTQFLSFNELKLLVSVPLQRHFVPLNDGVTTGLNAFFFSNTSVVIQAEASGGMPIFDKDGNQVFYLSSPNSLVISSSEELILMLVLLCAYVCFVLGGIHFFTKSSKTQGALRMWAPFSLVGMVLLWIGVKNHIPLNHLELFSPNLYASSEVLSDLGSLLFLALNFLLFTWWNFLNYRKDCYLRRPNVLLFLWFFVSGGVAFFLNWLMTTFVANSTIPLDLDKIFELNSYSLVILLVSFILFLSFYFLQRTFFAILKHASLPLNRLIFWWVIGCAGYAVVELIVGTGLVYMAIWPILFQLVVYIAVSYQSEKITFASSVVLLSLSSFIFAYLLNHTTAISEFQNRELFANQLLNEQDPLVEFEFLQLAERLSTELSIETDFRDSVPAQFKARLMSCCMTSFWERFDVEFHLFDKSGNPILNYLPSLLQYENEINELIAAYGRPSAITDALFYIINNFDRLIYIGKLPVLIGGEKASLIINIRSKKMSENVGSLNYFLNQRKSADAIKLADYAIGRYDGNRLVHAVGSFHFPLSKQVFKKQLKTENGWVKQGDYNHLIITNSDKQTIVLSKREKRIFENLTIFSYLILFYGLLIILLSFLNNRTRLVQLKNLQLSLKIQMGLVGIVVFGLLSFGVVAGMFVKSQHEEITDENLRDKLSSITLEVNQKLGLQNTIDAPHQKEYIHYILRKFSHVFATDINLFSTNGRLIASSSPNIFDKGFQSKQMNTLAFYELKYNAASEIIQPEQILGINYLAAYRPFVNKNGNLLGYLHLQHLPKQSSYENQISEFLIGIINVAILLLVLSVIAALYLAKTITAPLRLLQDNFNAIELGKENQPIEYYANDEIGALVKDYNAKLAELEQKALELAQTERESAWREMAKQVAHEIKNPLTPMKLSLQHFQRSFDLSQPQAEERIKHLTKSLIEQIDALSKIANEFSNFAKMPKAKAETVDLMDVITSCVDVFNPERNTVFIHKNNVKAFVFADKNLLIRVFNNLIKNALQAIPEGRLPRIDIHVETVGAAYVIEIKDNGIGIPASEHHKIFVPNFTTKSTGTGIGLAIVKQIVKTHHGDIWFSTEEGKGSSFFVKIPKHD